MYARCTTFDPRDGSECAAEIEPMDDGRWQCPNCGPLDPSDGTRCDECGTIETYWGGDNLVCPRCIEEADEEPLALAYAYDGQIRLHVCAGGRDRQEVGVALTSAEALVLGASLINYAIAADPVPALTARRIHGETDWDRKLRKSARSAR
jgi:hypothetical protein